MLWQRQKQTKTDPQPWLVDSFSEQRKVFFHPDTHTCAPSVLDIHNMFTAFQFSLFFFFSICVTWPLKESDEFTADSLWLRRAGSTDGMTLSEVGAYRY